MINVKENLTGEINVKNTLSGELNVSKEFISPPLIDLEINPTKEQQVFNHEDSYGYDNVIVNSIPEEYIIPDGTLPITENATYDVRKYARVSASVYLTPYLQDKEVEITENGTQNITFDEGYDGLNSVEVKTKVSGSKYAPRTIAFPYYPFNELDYELENLDYKNLTSIDHFLYYSKNLTEINLSAMDTSNVTNMVYAFGSCSNLKTLDLSNFDFGNVLDMSNMFYYCSSLETVNFGISNANNLTTTSYMFYYCKNMLSVDMSNFNNSSVTKMNDMFNGCTALISVDLSGFTGENTTDISYMFYGCTSLKRIDLRNFDFSKAKTISSFLGSVPSDCLIIVKDGDQKYWITSKASKYTNVKTVAEL